MAELYAVTQRRPPRTVAEVAAWREEGNAAFRRSTPPGYELATVLFSLAGKAARDGWVASDRRDLAYLRELALCASNGAATELELRSLAGTTGHNSLHCLATLCRSVAGECLVPGSAEWEHRLRPGCEAWLPAAYAKLLWRQAKCALALGLPTAAQPLLSHLAETPSSFQEAATSLLPETRRPPPTSHAFGLAASWRLLRLDPARAPVPRRHARFAALGGSVYMFGGTLHLADPCLDSFWRLVMPPAAGMARWERLPPPERHGGPGPTARDCVLLALPRRKELLVVAGAHAFVYEPVCGTWRDFCLGDVVQPWLRESVKRYAVSDDETTLYYLPLERAAPGTQCTSLSLFRWELPSGGPPTVLLTSLQPSGPRPRTHAQLWCAGSKLYLWGGAEQAESVPGGPPRVFPHAHYCDFWQLDLAAARWAAVGRAGRPQQGLWGQCSFDGPGLPPAPRAELATAALPGGRRLFFGGYSERLHHLATGTDGETGVRPFQYLNDAHVSDAVEGWLPLRFPAGQRAPRPAAEAGLVHDAASGRVFALGGWAEFDDHPLNADVFELLIPGSIPPTPPPPPEPREPALPASLLGALTPDAAASPLHAPTARMMTAASPCGARRHPIQSGPELSTRVALARRVERDVGQLWQASWSCAVTQPGPSPAHFLDYFAVSLMARIALPGTPPVDFCILTAEPTARDVAVRLVAAILEPQHGRPLRPSRVLLAARMASLAPALTPLLVALDIELQVETWLESAQECFDHNTCPWGFNCENVAGHLRCVVCKARCCPEGGKLKKCSKCKKARYCGQACAEADWKAHKPLCKFYAARREE